jgi:hypothetical protein
MPNWQRHVTGTTTTGGFWTSTTTNTFADNCSTADKSAIQTAFNSLSANGGLNCFPALRDKMIPSFTTISVDCCFDASRPPRGGEVEAFVFVCQMTARQIQVELCKGLVGVNLGTTLDVKAMLMSCFGAPEGIPTSAQFNEMVGLPQMPNNANEFAGEFCIWNRNTGEVFDKTTTTVGGFWTSSTVPAKGPRCFINNAWVF